MDNSKDEHKISRVVKKEERLNFSRFFCEYLLLNKNIDKLESLRSLGKRFRVSKNTIAKWIQDILYTNYGLEKSKILYNRYLDFHSISHKYQHSESFFEYLDRQFYEFYPKNLQRIDSLNKLSREFSLTRITTTDWVKRYLNENYNSCIAQKLFREIWETRRFTLDTSKRINFIDIINYISNRNGNLITSQTQFNKMNEIPSRRYVELLCERGHYFLVQIQSMIYSSRWCPQCLDYKTEHIMRLFMEKIFGVRFPETSLFRALGIKAKNDGRLRIDGFNGCVNINNKNYKIGFEYDGLQHDIYPNRYHKTKNEFYIQKARDLKKRKILMESQVILINIKKVNGYDIDNIDSFQMEVIRQFENLTNEVLPKMGLFVYDPILQKLKPKG